MTTTVADSESSSPTQYEETEDEVSSSEDPDDDSEEFSLAGLNLRDDDGNLSALLDEFRDATVPKGNTRFPPMVLMLQHFEALLSFTDIEKMALMVSTYFANQRKNTSAEVYIDATSSLYCKLRRIIGKAAFDCVSRKLRNGEITMALGLAPSMSLRSRKCPDCRARRCLHRFCPECGMIFNIKLELCKEMNLSAEISSREKETASSSKKRRLNQSKLEHSKQFPKPTDDTKPIIRRPRDIQNRYDQEGMIGIRELYRSVKTLTDFRLFGGDVLLLLRNIAVVAVGEPKALAVTYCQEVCARWMSEHQDSGSKFLDQNESDDDEELADKLRENYFKDAAEGLYVINKMLLEGSRERRDLFDKTDSPDDGEDSTHSTTVLAASSRTSSASKGMSTTAVKGNHQPLSNSSSTSRASGASNCGSSTAQLSFSSGHADKNASGREDKYNTSLVILMQNKAGPRDGDAPVFYNKWGEAVEVDAKAESNDTCLYDDLGKRVSYRNLMKKAKQDSRKYSSSSSSSSGVNSLIEEMKKRKVPPFNSCKNERSKVKAGSSSDRNSVSRTSSKLSPIPPDFTEAALLIRQSLSFNYVQGSLIDFIPTRVSSGDGRRKGGRTPLLPASTAGFCGECACIENNKGKSNCTHCGQPLLTYLDYSSVLDTLLWSLFFASMQIDDSCLYEEHCRAMVQLLPLVRCYQSIEHMGVESFKSQCYFATHVIYFFSDYGQHALSRELFSEEFRLFVTHLDHVCKELKDVELAGEFVQCLKIMQYTKEADPELEPLITGALGFLLNRARDSKEPLLNEYDRKYKSYHTSYCAAIGLLDYDFLQSEETRLNPPVPGILKLCDTYQC